MGINLGAALSPVVCGYIGETYGWHYGFGLATIGMIIGIAVFVAPIRLTQVLVLGGALMTAVTIPFLQDSLLQLLVRIFLSLALATAGIVAFIALGKGGLPDHAGAPADPSKLKQKIFGFLRKDWAVYLGVLVAIPLIALLVQRNQIAGWTLTFFGAMAFLYLIYAAVRSEVVERHRMFVVLILMFFSMLFWAFFEQAGSSVNNFTDRNVDRQFEERTIEKSDIGKTIKVKLGQEQFGYQKDDQVVTLSSVQAAKESKTNIVDWTVTEKDVGMGVGGAEIPASEFQAANPIFILIFGLLFTALWSFMGTRNIEPSTPIKFSFGLLQLGLGFGALWYGAQNADSRGMVSLYWLLLGYLLQTTGELCLSPVGLSMVTKLSPGRLVSTVMGAWFLATAFSNYLAGIIAMFTGITHEEGGSQVIPPPVETVNIYGDVFGTICLTAIASAVICFLLAPILKKWMHGETT
jgi:POT family proton-dependent oligopeptide transporter